MAFPDTPLGSWVEMYIGAEWVNLTAARHVYTREPITITRGRADESTQVTPTACTLTLNNKDGRYSPRNPRSPYFGLIGRNTPIRVSVPEEESYLDLDGSLTGNAATPDTAALHITGDLDVRVEATMNWLDTGHAPTLMGRYDGAGDSSWALRLAEGRVELTWSPDGTALLGMSAFLPSYMPERAAVRAALDVDNGAGGYTCVLYWAPSLDGPWEEVFTFTGAGVTSVHAGSQPLEVAPAYVNALGVQRRPMAGQVHRAEVRSGINGTVVASPDFRALAPGTATFTDGAGVDWTLAGSARISDRAYRFVGEVSSWPPRWDTSGADVWVSIEAAGILRRLSQGRKPLQSTLRRLIPSGGGQAVPRAYWPMEEGEAATQAYSPIEGVAPLRVSGLDWASDDSLFGSDALPTLGQSASISGRVSGAQLGGWHVDLSYRLEALPSTEQTVLRVSLRGSRVAYAQVRISTSGVRVQAYDSEDALLGQFLFANAGALAAFVGVWNRLQLFSSTSGGTTNITAAWRDVVTGVRWAATATQITGAPGAVTGVSGTWGSDLQGMAVGHLGVWDVGGTIVLSPLATTPGITYFDDADDGFEGETAYTRHRRLSAEEQLPIFVRTGSESSERVGPQRVQTVLDLLESAASADGGLLCEHLRTSALSFRSRSSLYNQVPALALEYRAWGEVAPPLEPVEDDQQTRNDITITHEGGSAARAVLETGPLSVQPPPDGVGLYDESLTLNLATDGQAEGVAAWRLHLGTWDEARYPTVHLRLHKAPHLVSGVLGLRLLDRITIANPPPWLPPDTIDLLVEGWTETLGIYTWDVTLNCSPGGPWQVATVVPDTPAGEPSAGPDRVDTDGSELALPAEETAGELAVYTPLGGTSDRSVWVTAGQLLTPNGAFAVDLAGWVGAGAAIARAPAPGPAPFSNDWCMQVTPDGVAQYPNAGSDQIAVTEGHTYVASGWMRCATARTVGLSTNWFDGVGGAYLATTGNDITVHAGEWTWFEAEVTAPAGAAAANISPTIPDFPPGTDVLWACEVWLRPTGGHPSDLPYDVRVSGEIATVHNTTSYVLDKFVRPSVTGTWGAADSGQGWTLFGGTLATDYELTGTAGQITLVANDGQLRQALVLGYLADVEALCAITPDQLATGSAHIVGLIARSTDVSHYWLDMLLGTDGSVTLELRLLATVQAAVTASVVYSAGTRLWLRMRVIGDGRVLGRVWADGAREPSVWHIDHAIVAGVLPEGDVGVCVARGTASTNTEPAFAVDHFEIVNPQMMTVTRSVNGITKSHAAGADLRLAHPAIVAL